MTTKQRPLNLLIILVFFVTNGSNAFGQDWAQKLFKVTRHDFGTVAKGSDAVYQFNIKNIYKEEIHVASVRSSCGCTTATIINDTIKSLETGAIQAKFNTISFLGPKSATITVVIDRPYYAEVQLDVSGNIRGDIALNPGAIRFGSIDQGESATKQLIVSYAGPTTWKIQDVRSGNADIEVRVKEEERANRSVKYLLEVTLKETAKAGFVKDQLILVTNDRRGATFPVHFTAEVVPAIAASPTSLFLGNLKPGDKVTKKIIVKGKEPFKVTNLSSKLKGLEFQIPETSKKLHILSVSFTAEEEGEFSEQIEIETDQEGTKVGCLASVTVGK
ncbi:MAG: DUF1573 domain-containing protein [Pirellulaceae bacterium]|nr:DUF1573 domain-containing protein [Pirellulaceae bacterium]